MSRPEHDSVEDLVRVCRSMYEKGWAAANDGNVSVRLADDRILCTPTAMCKGHLSTGDFVVCEINGHKLEGEREATSEILMHATIYSRRPDVRAVVHAHPPVATGFAAAGRALDLALLPEVIIQLGAVPLARYGLPGTSALSEGMLPYVDCFDAMLLENHGCTTYGQDVWQAFHRMETVEHFAKITLIAEMAGGAKPLPRAEVEKLFESRKRYNVHSRASMHPGLPLVLEDLLK